MSMAFSFLPMLAGILVGLLVLIGGGVLAFFTENKKAGIALLVVGAVLTICPLVAGLGFYFMVFRP